MFSEMVGLRERRKARELVLTVITTSLTCNSSAALYSTRVTRTGMASRGPRLGAGRYGMAIAAAAILVVGYLRLVTILLFVTVHGLQVILLPIRPSGRRAARTRCGHRGVQQNLGSR
jgi:hypothetical protein